LREHSGGSLKRAKSRHRVITAPHHWHVLIACSGGPATATSAALAEAARWEMSTTFGRLAVSVAVAEGSVAVLV
jgi:hypothetical protein